MEIFFICKQKSMNSWLRTPGSELQTHRHNSSSVSGRSNKSKYASVCKMDRQNRSIVDIPKIPTGLTYFIFGIYYPRLSVCHRLKGYYIQEPPSSRRVVFIYSFFLFYASTPCPKCRRLFPVHHNIHRLRFATLARYYFLKKKYIRVYQRSSNNSPMPKNLHRR